MSDQTERRNGNEEHPATAHLRSRLASLESTIAELRSEADRLRSSARARRTVVSLERPPARSETAPASRGPDATVDAASTDADATVVAFPLGTPGPEQTEAPAAASGEPAQAAAADGLDAIEASVSTDMPADWNVQANDEAAFDRFFSAEVEPEPAQRWLLNE